MNLAGERSCCSPRTTTAGSNQKEEKIFTPKVAKVTKKKF
jgi:hypothetical protein